MDPLVSKLIFVIGYLVPMFVIRGPHIKDKKTQIFRPEETAGPDTLFFVLTSIGNALIPLIYFTPLLSFADYESPLAVGIAGALLFLPGHWIFYRAHRDLGKNWSPILELREEHALVTEGIYQRIRHPMYTSVWIFVIAQALLLPNWVAGLSGLVPFACLYFSRVHKEERMMKEQFGTQYEEYLKQTGRLLPRL